MRSWQGKESDLCRTPQLLDVSKQAVDVLTSSESCEAFSREVHHYVRDYIQLADQKAGFLFAALSASSLLAYNTGLYRHEALLSWFDSPHRWKAAQLTAFFAVIPLICSAAAAVAVVIPRRESHPGIVFWQGIIRFRNKRDYADKVIAADSAILTRALLEDAYGLAKACRRKYRALRIAIWAGTIGAASTLLFLLIK